MLSMSTYHAASLSPRAVSHLFSILSLAGFEYYLCCDSNAVNLQLGAVRKRKILMPVSYNNKSFEMLVSGVQGSGHKVLPSLCMQVEYRRKLPAVDVLEN